MNIRVVIVRKTGKSFHFVSTDKLSFAENLFRIPLIAPPHWEAIPGEEQSKSQNGEDAQRTHFCLEVRTMRIVLDLTRGWVERIIRNVLVIPMTSFV